jgi:hypothetical protein
MVEAAGVELFRVLTVCKLLVLGTATTAKMAPLPDPLYVYCTIILSLYLPRRWPSLAHFASCLWTEADNPNR